MSSNYPILASRPIDQWRVTELKEELKRRKLATKGLKDDLLKRLDQALRAEMDASQEDDEPNGFNSHAELADTILNKSGETIEIAENVHTGLVEPIETEDAEKIQEVVDNDQVSEVNRSLGYQVKSESTSTNYVSITQKNELKDTILAENVNLEQDIVRPEMVEKPSSRNDVSVYDESHSMDVEELHVKKASIEENSSNNKSPDMNKINSSEDVEYLEKLDLDRSSGDDSMEEDLSENKVESVEVPIVKEEGCSVVAVDNDTPPVFLVEKRKFHGQASVGNNEPPKRQRRWNSGTIKVSDAQSPTLGPVTTPKDEPITFKRNFSRSDSSAMDNIPKERFVPPSQRAPTNSLKIDRFLRPFTLKAVQDLLGKTGNVVSFWMDQIKTHCYVTYSSAEEAIETRNAVYNLQWPPNGGRLLVAEYVDPQEVKMKLEPPIRVASVNNGSTVPPITLTSRPVQKEQPPAPVTLPPPPPLSKPPPAAAREQLPSPPPLPEKVDKPIVTLADLFRKTSAAPRIYYSPLSEKQVAAKLSIKL